LTVLERQIVDIHADEPIRPVAVQASAKLHGILHRLVPMFEAVGDAVMQQVRKRRHPIGAQVASDDVSPQWKRQPARAICPPLPPTTNLPTPPPPSAHLSLG